MNVHQTQPHEIHNPAACAAASGLLLTGAVAMYATATVCGLVLAYFLAPLSLGMAVRSLGASVEQKLYHVKGNQPGEMS